MLVNPRPVSAYYEYAHVGHAIVDGRARWADPLPDREGYGWCSGGVSERCVELPLALEAIGWQEPGLLLDAGAGLAHDVVRKVVGPPQESVVHVCQAPHDHPVVTAHNSFYFGDLRKLPFRDGAFDRSVCVSTLEHIGMDNSKYGGAAEHNREAWPLAWDEILRVTKPGGTVFVSVPYGQAADCQWFQVFDGAMITRLRKLVTNRNGAIAERVFSRATPTGGWRDGGDAHAQAVLCGENGKDRVLQIWCGLVTCGSVEDNQ